MKPIHRTSVSVLLGLLLLALLTSCTHPTRQPIPPTVRLAAPGGLLAVDLLIFGME